MYSLIDEIMTTKKPKIKYRNKAKFGKNRRTDIQLGGNLDFLNIPERFDIKLGDNLQKDIKQTKKSASLLGALQSWSSQLTKLTIDNSYEKWRSVGINLLNQKKESKKIENNPPIKIARKDRTKTLAQLGGLFSLIDALEKFEIKLGDDLQVDLNSKSKSAALIGSLKEYFDQMNDIQIKKNLFNWQETGFSLMKKRKENKEKYVLNKC